MHRRHPHLPNDPRCRSTRGSCKSRHGFTLLELLLVLSILVVIGGIVMVNLGGAADDAKRDTTRAQINAIKQAIGYYQIRMNSIPESLQELVDGPSDASKKAKWTSSILPEVPMDGWENEFNYSVSGNTYEIRSNGIDGQPNTDDDITESGP